MHDDDDFPHHDHGSLNDLSGEATIEEIEGLERFTITSVGIDIGSSTSHLIFSRLILRRQGSAFSSQFKVTDRQVLYRSPIMLTPYLSETLIDSNKINYFVHQAYRDAGFTPDQVDTGAVVITGEALKKENAQPITELFARESGKFICVSAGPNHEALLAAHGCGAVALSQAENATVLNIDMGGGTTKLSLIRQGVVIETAAISVGARLIAFDQSNTVTRLEAPAKLMLDHLGIQLSVGDSIGQDVKESFAGLMAKVLLELLGGETPSSLVDDLMVTDGLADYRGPEEVDLLVFSGGVSEYLYGHDATPYGDVGPLLGHDVREMLGSIFKGNVLHDSAEGIRATVIGACEYTVQASGTTSHLSGVQALPAFSLQVVRPVINGEDTLAEATQKALAKFDLPGFGPGLALAFSIEGEINYQSLRKLAKGISDVVTAPTAVAKAPLFIVLDTDVAKSLGGILKEDFGLKQDLIVVDGIDAGDLDYLDIGLPMGVSEVVPVTVKSLVFQANA